MTDGKKFDQGKLRYDLLGPQATEQTVAVLTHGAAKYGDTNWVKVEPFNDRYFAAVMRHLWAWRRGEEIDPDSGLAHLAHAAAGCHILLAKALGDDAHLPSDDEEVEYTAVPCPRFFHFKDDDLCLRGPKPDANGKWRAVYHDGEYNDGEVRWCHFSSKDLEDNATPADLEFVALCDDPECGVDGAGRAFLVIDGLVYYEGEVTDSGPPLADDTFYRVRRAPEPPLEDAHLPPDYDNNGPCPRFFLDFQGDLSLRSEEPDQRGNWLVLYISHHSRTCQRWTSSKMPTKNGAPADLVQCSSETAMCGFAANGEAFLIDGQGHAHFADNVAAPCALRPTDTLYRVRGRR